MAEKIASKNGLISNSEGLVTLTLDWVMLHTHRPLPMPNFIEIKETSVDRETDGRTYARCVRTHVAYVRTLRTYARTD